MAPGGTLAFQVPGNFEAPSHTLLSQLSAQPQWASKLGPERDKSALASLGPAQYTSLLAPLGFAVNAWETTYLHLLPAPAHPGDHTVLEWMKGTALRPILAQLNGPDAEHFSAQYGALLRAAYPSAPYGTPFPFRRVFVVANKL